MSKRKRPADTDPEDTTHVSADNLTVSHDDNSTAGDMAPPGPYSYTRENRKQVRPRNKPDDNRQHTKHPFFGQASALPPADTTSDGEEDEATAYLRSVRAEAEGLASVVTAYPQATYDDQDYDPEHDYNDDNDDYEENDHGEDEDTAGWYEDGAYIGAPTTAHTPYLPPTAQSLYYSVLCTRFRTLRARLHIEPSLEDKASIPPEQPTTVPNRHNELAHREWRYHLRSTEPVPLQLRAMESRTVLQLLSMVDGQLEASVNEARNITAVTSRWIWGLLGRLGTAGQLSTQQVGTVRDLAKTAVWVGYKYRKRSVEGGEASELEAAKARMLGRLEGEEDQVPDANTLATLDLIITVAGEFYGQKDLLQSRLPWEQAE